MVGVKVRLSSGAQDRARVSCVLKGRSVPEACQGGEASVRNNGNNFGQILPSRHGYLDVWGDFQVLLE